VKLGVDADALRHPARSSALAWQLRRLESASVSTEFHGHRVLDEIRLGLERNDVVSHCAGSAHQCRETITHVHSSVQLADCRCSDFGRQRRGISISGEEPCHGDSIAGMRRRRARGRQHFNRIARGEGTRCSAPDAGRTRRPDGAMSTLRLSAAGRDT